jgi:hypothetical protein
MIRSTAAMIHCRCEYDESKGLNQMTCAYGEPADQDLSDPPNVAPVDVGFNQDTSFYPMDIPNENFGAAPYDRHITAANDPVINQGGGSGGSFPTGPDKHII